MISNGRKWKANRRQAWGRHRAPLCPTIGVFKAPLSQLEWIRGRRCSPDPPTQLEAATSMELTSIPFRLKLPLLQNSRTPELEEIELTAPSRYHELLTEQEKLSQTIPTLRRILPLDSRVCAAANGTKHNGRPPGAAHAQHTQTFQWPPHHAAYRCGTRPDFHNGLWGGLCRPAKSIRTQCRERARARGRSQAYLALCGLFGSRTIRRCLCRSDHSVRHSFSDKYQSSAAS